ncbi:hypothetical protein B566_EDAN015831 [Ephemera danica]|nr:hypothetical protein B566_EDAN015831 [Ephemera danica]
MATITANDKFVTISTGSSALVWSKECSTGKVKNLEQPRSLPFEDGKEDKESSSGNKKVPKKGQTSFEHEERHMACVALSPCGEWLALASSRGQKQLGLWRTSDWTMVSARAMPRAASCVRFTPSSNAVLVADKAGDVYLYSVKEYEKEMEWLLGHIAMLLDILITPDERFLISCDRDEKIRVSCFPNTYNIHSYCLGHDLFVSSLLLLPHNTNTLVSTSGDGSLRLWDYLSGRQLSCVDVQQKLKPDSPQDENPLAVKSCVGLKLDSTSSLLCVCIGGSSVCAVFLVSEDAEHGLSVSLVQQLQLAAELWSLSFTPTGQLLTLCHSQVEAVTAWSWDTRQKSVISAQHPCLEPLNGQWETIKSCFANPSVPSLLYRRKYADDGEGAVPAERPVKVLKS